MDPSSARPFLPLPAWTVVPDTVPEVTDWLPAPAIHLRGMIGLLRLLRLHAEQTRYCPISHTPRSHAVSVRGGPVLAPT